jgi:ribonuclease PH
MPRSDGRLTDQLRPLRIVPGYLKDPEGSALIEMGRTWVICTASVDERVPAWLREAQQGWVTAEYAMLPRSTTTRSPRGGGGRAKEIERLIGRSLRAAVDLAALGNRTITIDCDVLQADGGTRTAAITGGFVALALACQRLVASKLLARSPIREAIAAVSVGMVDGEPCLDLAYEEDARAEVDMNVVMTNGQRLVEVQGTGEHATFSRDELLRMTDLAAHGIRSLLEAQQQVLAGPPARP